MHGEVTGDVSSNPWSCALTLFSGGPPLSSHCLEVFYEYGVPVGVAGIISYVLIMGVVHAISLTTDVWFGMLSLVILRCLQVHVSRCALTHGLIALIYVFYCFTQHLRCVMLRISRYLIYFFV